MKAPQFAACGKANKYNLVGSSVLSSLTQSVQCPMKAVPYLKQRSLTQTEKEPQFNDSERFHSMAINLT